MTFYNSIGDKVFLSIRLAKEEDVPEIIDCIKAVYNDISYARDYYSPNYLKDLINGESLQILLITNEKNMVIACIAFGEDEIESKDTSVGFLMVRKEYRGYKIGSYLVKYAVDQLKAMGTNVIKAYAVSEHYKAQDILEELGFIPTGFLPSAKISESNLRKGARHRRTLVIYTLGMQDNMITAKKLYIPSEAISVFNLCLKQPYIKPLDKAGNIAVMNLSRIEQRFDKDNSVTYIKVTKYGIDFTSNIDKTLFNINRVNFPDVIIVRLNLADSGTILAHRTLIDKGFRFCGFDLMRSSGNYMLMYYSKNLIIRWENLSLSEQSSKFLKEVLNER